MQAKRSDPAARLRLHQLLVENPGIAATLQSFAADAKRKAKTPAQVVVGTWERAASRAGKWISLVSGGLPSLGKKR